MEVVKSITLVLARRSRYSTAKPPLPAMLLESDRHQSTQPRSMATKEAMPPEDAINERALGYAGRRPVWPAGVSSVLSPGFVTNTMAPTPYPPPIVETPRVQ
eukprot:GHVU01144606.1.p1 GENE.GHVU01144606.1~~GHVU01144606.1.p1  ORF type:complete len:102 (+),score=3.46 GHVU01144606.1:186-491(+)